MDWGGPDPGPGMRTMTQKITLTINGKSYTDEVEPRLLSYTICGRLPG
jgi:hypothetical protein